MSEDPSPGCNKGLSRNRSAPKRRFRSQCWPPTGWPQSHYPCVASSFVRLLNRAISPAARLVAWHRPLNFARSRAAFSEAWDAGNRWRPECRGIWASTFERPARSLTCPPASRTSRVPPATSQGLSPRSQKTVEPSRRDIGKIKRCCAETPDTRGRCHQEFQFGEKNFMASSRPRNGMPVARTDS